MTVRDSALVALRVAPDSASRDRRVLDAIRAGAELDEIGTTAGVTRERIRQIVRDAAARTNYEPRDLLADVLAV